MRSWFRGKDSGPGVSPKAHDDAPDTRPEVAAPVRNDNDAQSAPHGFVLSSPYFDTLQAATYLGTSSRTLERFRLVGGGPKYAKVGRKVVYRKEWLDEWLEGRCFTSTSEARSKGIR